MSYLTDRLCFERWFLILGMLSGVWMGFALGQHIYRDDAPRNTESPANLEDGR